MSTKLHPTHRSTDISRGLPWRCCGQCGLVYLRNKATADAMRKRCPGHGNDDQQPGAK